MILQALVNHYEALAQKGEISRPGWSKVRASYALEIDEDGSLKQVIPLKYDSGDGKKMLPRVMEVPAPVKRTVGIESNFLCDNSAYILGFDGKGKPARAKECFEEASRFHLSLLKKQNEPFAIALHNYFKSWDANVASENELFISLKDDLEKGANIIFFYDGQFANDNKTLSQIWDSYYNSDENKDAATYRCLVTSETVVPANIHPSVKGVMGAQSSGAALVAFNAQAFCSYDKEQNFNAPVGKYAAFAYTTALNHLISNREHTKRFGDTTVVYWAEDAKEGYQDAFSGILDGDSNDDSISNDDLNSFMNSIVQGKSANWGNLPIEPENKFYILGLSPNSARLSVRFFFCNTFGSFVENIQKHYDNLEIVLDGRSKSKKIPLWILLRETINEKSSDKSASPQMAGDTLRAILTGGQYPATLYQQTQIRIRAENKINHGRAAIIKAYLTRNANNKKYKEVLTVELNENTRYQPYVLGRLFSVAEAIQDTASGVTTIKDRYFTSASTTPAVIMPMVLGLAEKHLRKLGESNRIYYAKQLGELMSMIDESYPAHYNLYDQGIFQLGYYHQVQKRFIKKEKADTAEIKED